MPNRTCLALGFYLFCHTGFQAVDAIFMESFTETPALCWTFPINETYHLVLSTMEGAQRKCMLSSALCAISLLVRGPHEIASRAAVGQRTAGCRPLLYNNSIVLRSQYSQKSELRTVTSQYPYTIHSEEGPTIWGWLVSWINVSWLQ